MRNLNKITLKSIFILCNSFKKKKVLIVCLAYSCHFLTSRLIASVLFFCLYILKVEEQFPHKMVVFICQYYMASYS